MYIAIITPPRYTKEELKKLKNRREHLIDIPAQMSKTLLNLTYILKEVKNYSVFACDYYYENISREDCVDDLISYEPNYLFVCLDIDNLDVDFSFLDEVKKAVENCIIVAVNLNFLEDPEDWLRNNLYFDYGIYDIPEAVIWKFEGNIDKLPGTMKVLDLGRIKRELPLSKEDYECLKELRNYYGPINFNNFKSKYFGEPWAKIDCLSTCAERCIFCYKAYISDKILKCDKTTLIDEEKIMKDIDELVKHGVKNIIFEFDFDMLKNYDYIQHIITYAIEKHLNYGVMARVDFFKDEVIEIFSKSGCKIIIGKLPAICEESLKKINVDPKLINIAEQLFDKLENSKLYTVCKAFFGYPWESKEILDKSFERISKWKYDAIDLHLIIPYYKTDLYYHAKAMNKLVFTNRGYRCNIKDMDVIQLYEYKKKIYNKIYFSPSRLIHYLLKIPKNFGIIGDIIKIYSFILNHPGSRGIHLVKFEEEKQRTLTQQEKQISNNNTDQK
jgi:radical SAM superfamily enzyme